MLKKYFVRANTACGCVNFGENNFDMHTVYRLCGKSAAVKSYILKMIANHFDLLGETVECIVSPFDITRYEAVIVRSADFAAADENIYSGGRAVGTDICITGDIDEEYMNVLSEKEQTAYKGLCGAYAQAKKIHDEWEQIYISNMNYDMLGSYTSGVMSRLVGEKQDSSAVRYDRFFGASTPDGSVNYIDNITAGLERRYFIKGRPGTGKSTFLKRLQRELENAGYDTEVYWCSFDKDSLDMVLAPQLSFCVFDSTAPHELFPSRSGDSVLDFYKEAGLTGIDEKYAKQLELVSKKYSFRISEGVTNLRLGICFDREREFYYERASDMEQASRIADKIIRKGL